MSGSSVDKKIILNARPEVMVCLFLVIVTLAVYWQVRNHSFLNFDDGLYVTDNYHVRAGLSLESVKWALTETEAANWHPLTRLSHMLDVQLFGMNAGAHHMTSMFFHLANALLLFFVFKRMTGCLWQSGLVAALFAFHPLHVESVAWVSERKDVLSTFFWLLTMGGYVLYVERPGKIRFFIPLLFFALGLMAKPMLVTLPFVLLLMDYWPLGRLGGAMMPFGSTDVSNRSDNPHPASRIAQPVAGGQRALILRLVIEKIPFFALSAASCWMTIHAQQGKGAVVVRKISGGCPGRKRCGILCKIYRQDDLARKSGRLLSAPRHRFMVVGPYSGSIARRYIDSGNQNHQAIALVYCRMAVVSWNAGAGNRSSASRRAGHGR